MTWLFLAQLLAALTATIYRDYLRKNTEELDRLTWDACLLREETNEQVKKTLEENRSL